jgi:hypothetical protein
MRKIVLYFGHKLTHADPGFLSYMESVKNALETVLKDRIVILKFLGVTAGNCGDVYDKDIEENVATCELFVCFVDEESTGLGIEIGAALWRYGKPILILYTGRKRISRLIGGAYIRNQNQIMDYEAPNIKDVIAAVIEAIEHFNLDTDHPATFACLESLRPGPLFGKEAPIYANTERALGTNPSIVERESTDGADAGNLG